MKGLRCNTRNTHCRPSCWRADFGACAKHRSAAVQKPAIGDTRPDAAFQDRNLDPAQVTRGRVIYDNLCAECHRAKVKLSGQERLVVVLHIKLPGSDLVYLIGWEMARQSLQQ